MLRLSHARVFPRSFTAARSLLTTTRLSTDAVAYARPLPPGALPAYDLAVELINGDAAAKRAKVERLHAELEKTGEDVEKTKLEKALEKLEIESEINLPEVRWNFKNGLLDLSKPVHRHMLERSWRNEGRLDKLMERVYQMHVVPDILPELHPTLDLRVNFSLALTSEEVTPLSKSPVNLEDVEPGVFLGPEQTSKPPTLKAQVYHTDTRLYTLLMVDPDVPSPATKSFHTYVHCLMPNIPLSVLETSITLPTSSSDSALQYVPPHPQQGTPYHRYTLLLLPQTSPAPLALSALPSREAFDVRAFVKEHKLDGPGGGIFFWRGVWDESVSKIYQEVLALPEPKYGKPPKFDPYVDEAGNRSRKYI
ncbi:hypothetical protein BOTBODRAFT_29825 [Botryobasidium botryosum FD-172 SS1]|uniref:PEBP-like protein n=1 Tax=Botryobasidium botryosum (strain FD-172 SS1) TaxID=930990 RepID=A0A067N1I8_BOTB1|nr:hypothetical protein BOTBODRAFT_29825 [Botryobasidium botryosum FD-172 SS1]